MVWQAATYFSLNTPLIEMLCSSAACSLTNHLHAIGKCIAQIAMSFCWLAEKERVVGVTILSCMHACHMCTDQSSIEASDAQLSDCH